MLQVRGILLALGLTGKLIVVLNQALDAPGPDGAFFCCVCGFFLRPLGSTGKLVVALDAPEVNQALDAPGADGAVLTHV